MKRYMKIYDGLLFSAIAIAIAGTAGASDGATYWWDNPEVVKSVVLADSAQRPQTMMCDAGCTCLALFSAGSDVANAYGVNGLKRRSVTNTVPLADSYVANFDFSGAYDIGGNSLRYGGKADCKVYVANGEVETALVDLSDEGAAIVAAKAARPVTDRPYLNVLLANGTVKVYRLAADGLSLASAAPVATFAAADALFAQTGAPALIEVSADGLALFFTTAAGDTIHVVRSADYALVDCVAANPVFPWRSDIPQTTHPHSTTDTGSVTIPPESATFSAPHVWPWAPVEIYGKLGYHSKEIVSTFSNLTPDDGYRAEYHFAENVFTAVGKRVYDLKVNDETRYANLDSYVVSGNTRRKAVALSYDVTAGADGSISFTLVPKTDYPIFCGFAIKGREAPDGLSFGAEFAPDGSAGTLTWGARDALAYYVQSAPSAEGPWTTILRDQTEMALAVSPGASHTVYYRVVASNGVGSVASAARCNRRDKYAVYAINCGFDSRRYGRFAPLDHCRAAKPVADLNGTAAPDFAGNAHALPSGVSLSQIYGYNRSPLDFSFANLRINRTYDVRIYACEAAFNAANSRVFSLNANGQNVLSGIDVYALADGRKRMVECVATGIAPRADGTIDLSLVPEKSDALLSAIEIVENDSANVPLVPVVHGAYARKNGVQVSIGSGTGELSYDIRRRPAAGGAYETRVTGLADTAWTDVGTTDGYVYSVRAVDAAGAAGDWSEDVAITPEGMGPQSFLGVSPQATVTFANANGAYVPWTLYKGANNLNEAAHAYSHELVLDPAPDGLYARILWGKKLDLVLTNLYPSATYRLRLQAIESVFTSAGKRVTSGVYANNVQIWGGFDAWREVGKGVFPIEGVVKATPGGTIVLITDQAMDNIDFCTVELFLLDGSSEGGVARAVRSGSANEPAWTQGTASTLDLSGIPDGLPVTGNEFIWDAMLSVPADGDYAFDVVQDGDYLLWIDDAVALEAHGGQATNATVALGIGDHHLRARYVQGGGSATVAIKWAGPTFARQSIAATSLTKSRTTDLTQDKWLQVEIGTSHAGELYKIGQKTADGSDIWRMTSSGVRTYAGQDESHFVFREVTASAFEARVRLRNIPYRESHSAFGLALRTDTLPFGGDYLRECFTGVGNPGSTTRWYAGSQGADFTVTSPSISNNVTWDLKLPVWHRVRKWRAEGRHLAEFAYSVDDAASWTVCCTNELTSTKPILVGLRATAGTQSRLVTFEFDHFELDVPPEPGTIVVIR